MNMKESSTLGWNMVEEKKNFEMGMFMKDNIQMAGKMALAAL